MKDSFTIYRTTLEALEALPPDIAVTVLSYVGHYAMDGIEPDNTEPISYAFFCQIKPMIDKSIRRSDAGRKGGENSKQTEANRKQIEANRKQTEANRKQTEAVKEKEERRKEKNINNNILSCASEYQYKDVVDYLNAKAGTAFKDKSKDTRAHIKARFDEGFSLDDFKTVVDKKVAEWRGTEMAKYLRPSTLFGTKFEAYLNQKSGKKIEFTPREYDYAALENELLRKQACMNS